MDDTEIPGRAASPKVASIAHALAVLRYLSAATAPQGVNAIARALGISPSSCFNILKTLAAEDYVDFNPKTKGYALGWAPVVLARRALDPANVLDLLLPDLEAMADKYDVACSLGRIARGERVILIGFAESDTATSIHLRVGQRVPLLAGASGRGIAAVLGLTRPEIERRFKALNWQNPPSLEAYLASVEAARAQGWAMDQDNSYRGVTTVSAVIVDSAGAPRYVTSNTMFTGQHTPQELTRIGQDAAALARRASDRLFGGAAP